MKLVILAGGFGTRISEESHLIPKPMIEIGDKPILWHIMKYYSSFGFNEFIICAGYKQYIIKEYFSDYYLHMSDITFDFSSGTSKMTVHANSSEPWKVTIVDTGLNTMTGGRIKRVADYVGNEPFFMTYGDGLADVDLNVALTKTQRKRQDRNLDGDPTRRTIWDAGNCIGFQSRTFQRKIHRRRRMDQWWLHGPSTGNLLLHQR